MTVRALSLIGLSLNMLATMILFFFGFPQPNHEEGVSLGVSEATVFADGTSVKEINRRQVRRRRIYRVVSSTGLLLMFLGFAAQLLAILSNP